MEAQRIAGVSYILNEHELRTSLQEAEPSRLGTFKERGHAGLILFSSGTSRAEGHVARFECVSGPVSCGAPAIDITLQLLLADHVGGLDCAFVHFYRGRQWCLSRERRLPWAKRLSDTE